MTANALIARYSDAALAGPLGSLDAYLERVSRVPRAVARRRAIARAPFP